MSRENEYRTLILAISIKVSRIYQSIINVIIGLITKTTFLFFCSILIHFCSFSFLFCFWVKIEWKSRHVCGEVVNRCWVVSLYVLYTKLFSDLKGCVILRLHQGYKRCLYLYNLNQCKTFVLCIINLYHKLPYLILLDVPNTHHNSSL